ncbi:hypothetical protein VCRA2117O380_30313 [Vibrio crassostreae]|nr:hypothetical protein VCRA2110O182_10129 [Vibrio crassostreae]CAK2053218.1 hypothetical protein VCRA2119O381_410032 [Vibrio crassostreae]CAK2066425.1 hypothetical protein VCRA2117O379_30313 [Vibrio crassostreae]CAK2067603.1 hypothetical protein VCRA2119O382_30313 [Vibrio crassostreae]CAK2070238.1 hypothetical protein VCRA2117O380_30313 [Vibrio crassostreae]
MLSLLFNTPLRYYITGRVFYSQLSLTPYTPDNTKESSVVIKYSKEHAQSALTYIPFNPLSTAYDS